jgi:hypothetical protein
MAPTSRIATKARRFWSTTFFVESTDTLLSALPQSSSCRIRMGRRNENGEIRNEK